MTHELEAKRAAAHAELTSIEAEITAARSAARTGNIAAVLGLMSEHGLTVADLGPAAARAPKVIKTTSVPMYVSDTGQTYGGRGKHPGWLRDGIASGRTMSSYRIGA